MEIKSEQWVNENGSYTRKTVKTATEEDGFVPLENVYSTGIRHVGEYHKGNMQVTSYTTDDPRVTRPFVYGICGLFIVIGCCLLFVSGFVTKFLAASFIGMGGFAMLKGKKEIDAKEKQHRERQKDGRR